MNEQTENIQDFIWHRQYAQYPQETFKEGKQRVARAVARAVFDEGLPRWQEAEEYNRRIGEYEQLLETFYPGGRIYAGAGTKHGQMLNCFVYDGSPETPGTTRYALATAKKLAITTKLGGGTGVNLDCYAPKHEYPGDTGKAYITINAEHPDYENVKAGRYFNQVTGQYDTHGYYAVEFVEQKPSIRADTYHLVTDSIEGIWEAGALMVRHLLKGKDVLIDLSNLRAEGVEVKGSGGTSSGPASFAVEVFENFALWAYLGGAEYAGPVATLRYVFAPTLRVIRQAGQRRGAGMATLSVTHPDIYDFITAKDLDREAAEGDISTYNISVLVDDQFMRNARDGDDTHQAALLRDIAEHAWKTGEPGLIFIDTINRYNPALDALGPIKATNPCVTGDTLVLTENGPIPFEELAAMHEENPDEPIHVWAYDDDFKPVLARMERPHKTGENVPILKLELDVHENDGPNIIRLTPNHKLYLHSGEQIEARHLKPGMRLASPHIEDKGLTVYPIDSFDWVEVLSVTEDGTADVYNGMVERFHNYVIVGDNVDGKSWNTGILSANCGEIPLYPGEPCDLGAINLSQFVTVWEDDDGEVHASIDYPLLAQTVSSAVRFLDDVLTVEAAPLPEVREAISRYRRIGLGVMGLADALIKLGVRYDTDEGREVVRDIMSFIRQTAVNESNRLGQERGVPEGVKAIGLNRRNIAILTVAPTGTTSMLAGASSGIEPVFSAVTTRRIGTEYKTIVHPLLVELLQPYDPVYWAPDFATEDSDWNWDALVEALQERHGSVQQLLEDGLIDDGIYGLDAFVVAHDISPEAHVLMQATVQQSYDSIDKAGNSISKTINLPNEATVEDVLSAYTLAWEQLCKGITVYRDGSRDLQVLNTSKAPKTQEEARKQIRAVIEEQKHVLDALARTGLPANDGSVTHATSTSGSEGIERLSNAGGVILEDVMRDTYSYVPQPYPELVPFEQFPSFIPTVFPANTYDVTFHPSQPERPQRVNGETFKYKVGSRTLYITVNQHQGRVVEVFVNLSRPTDTEQTAADIIGRLVSVALKYGAPVEDIIKHLSGHMDATGALVMKHGYMGSMWEAVADALRKSTERQDSPVPHRTTDISNQPNETITLPGPTWDTTEGPYVSLSTPPAKGDPCPDCGAPMVREEGCMKCYTCGYAACG